MIGGHFLRPIFKVTVELGPVDVRLLKRQTTSLDASPSKTFDKWNVVRNVGRSVVDVVFKVGNRFLHFKQQVKELLLVSFAIA